MTTDATPVPLPQDPAPARADAAGGELWPKILRVAWLSIVLGIVLEILLLVLAAYTGTGGTTPKPFISDLAQKVSWAFIVCVGLAFGSTASKARSGVMGLLGLISAPLGFNIARVVHKGANQALSIAGTAGGASVLLIATLKGIEYAVLGAILGWVTRRQGSLGLHLGAGAAMGLTFGVAIVMMLARAAANPWGQWTWPPGGSTRCSSRWAARWCSTPPRP
jgi:hypothetical protein